MKKKYVAPVADKVDFDYEENVVASGTPSQTNTACDCSCKKDHFVQPTFTYYPIPFITACIKRWWWW